MKLRELLDDALSLSGDPTPTEVVIDIVKDWLSQQETADVIYVAQTQTRVGPPLSAITAALIELAQA